jgi:hypothetical protein
VLSLFDGFPEEGELVVPVGPSGLAAVPCGVPPGGAGFSITLNAGGRGPSAVEAFSWASESSGVTEGAPTDPGWGCVPAARFRWGNALGGRRTTVAAGGVDVEDLLRKVAEGRLAVPGGDATLGG